MKPYIIHFPGKLYDKYKNWYELQLDTIIPYKPYELTIITCKSKELTSKGLIDQLISSEIPFINAYYYIPNYDRWFNSLKLDCYYKALEITKTRYALILDEKDVVIYDLLNLFIDYKSSGRDIIFGGTNSDWPTENENEIASKSSYNKYLNSGCVIGSTIGLTKLIKSALEYRNLSELPRRLYDSDQYLIKKVANNFEVYIDNKAQLFTRLY